MKPILRFIVALAAIMGVLVALMGLCYLGFFAALRLAPGSGPGRGFT